MCFCSQSTLQSRRSESGWMEPTSGFIISPDNWPRRFPCWRRREHAQRRSRSAPRASATNARAIWAAKHAMNLQSSTLKFDESGEPLHVQQAAQIRAFRAAWAEAGHTRAPRVSVSRSIFALMNDLDRAYFGSDGEQKDQIGFLDATTRAVFGRGYAAEPDVLIEQLKQDEALAEAD